jgi:predicted MFS family arabinose efflux permease
MSPSGGDVGPFQSLEQAILAQTSSKEKRNSVYAFYNMIGRLASSAGALMSVLPSLFESSFHLGEIESYRPLFVIYSVAAGVAAILYLWMSNGVESKSTQDVIQRVEISAKSKRLIERLSVLMGIDSFAGGFVLQSIVSYWFYTRYQVSLTELSVIFFTTGVLSSIAFIVSGKLADRIGAINTMVFTHLPSSILLILIPLAPSFILSLGLYIARQPLSLMDIPARQSYTMSVVRPSERTFAAGFSNMSSNAGRGASPTISGFVLQSISLSAPFFICGALKIAYDLTLYMNFRKVKESALDNDL